MSAPEDLEKLLHAFSLLGPRSMAAVSALTGLPEHKCKSVRDKLIENGVRFRANVDYWRIGLSRFLVLLDFNKETFPHAERIFHILAKAT